MSSEIPLLIDGPGDSGATLVLAHGAGAPMDSPFMNAAARALAERGLRVVRFEFPYMQARRTGGGGRAPDREPVLRRSWAEVVDQLGATGEARGRLVIGGKSMGGRMASLVADELGARGPHATRIAGLVCLGYPFHPPDRPERLRTAHLAGLATPTLIVQGTRDPFGTPDDVAGYGLSPAIRLVWIADGDHSLKPLKRSGRTEQQNLEEAWEAVAGFVAGLA
jgi:uncharacterized protein